MRANTDVAAPIAAVVASAAAGGIVIFLLRRRAALLKADDDESIAALAPGPQPRAPSAVDLSGARLKRLASAGFSTPLERRSEDGVCIISLGGAGDAAHAWGTKAAEHRLYPAAVIALDEALDAAEQDEAVRAVVVTAEGKYFCNGFDLKFLQEHASLMDDVQRATEMLCARILRFPKPTIAAVNGHACAAGAMLMLCFDEVVMNSERGFCFVPGIDLGLTYSPGMSALLSSRLPFALRHGFIVMGERLTALQLAEHHVVKPAPAARVLTDAVARAVALKPKAAHGHTMSAIKSTLYHEALAALEVEPDAIVVDPTFVPMGFQNLAEGVDKPAGGAVAAEEEAIARIASPHARRRRLPTETPVRQSARLPSVDALKYDNFVAATVQSQQDLRKWADPGARRG